MLHNNVKLKKKCFWVQPPSRHFNKIKKNQDVFRIHQITITFTSFLVKKKRSDSYEAYEQ